jgi:serine/threonine-protein phosphatase 5
MRLGSLDELLKARRTVLDPPWEGQNLIPGDVLWSDPSLEMGLSPNKERGIGLLWGPDITQQFLRTNNLKVCFVSFIAVPVIFESC